MDCSPLDSLNEIAVSETLEKVPECFFEAVSIN
jgi:hypothetical protein